MRALLLLALSGCIDDIKTVGAGAGLDLPGDIFGVVYECKFTDATETEFCWNRSEDSLILSLNSHGLDVVDCCPTPRHAGPCWYHCSGGRGCNAFGSCWCPEDR